MKKILLAILAALSVCTYGQNYSIQKNGTDNLVAEYAEEIIRENTPNDDRKYAFTLTQNDNSFTFEYVVTPDNINGKEYTDNVWDALEFTIKKAFANIRSSIATKKTVVQGNTQHIPAKISNNTLEPVDQSIYSTSNNSLGKQSNNLDDIYAGHASVGSLVIFPDGSQGIIFYLSQDKHGLAVSLRETKAKWDMSRKKDMQDIYQIPNTEHATAHITLIDEGAFYTTAILEQIPTYLCPAAAWCVSLGDGWYLPTASELLYLFQVANCKQADKGPISLALVSNGGTPFSGGWYWSCIESERTEALNILSKGGNCSTEEKSENNAVRAVRAF